MDYIQKRIRKSKIGAMEGLLKSQPYVEAQIAKTEEQISDIDHVLDIGAVSSISVVNSHHSTSPSLESRHAQLILEKQELLTKLCRLKSEKADIDAVYCSAGSEGRLLLELRYRRNLTFDQISSRTAMSRDTVRRTIETILANYEKEKK